MLAAILKGRLPRDIACAEFQVMDGTLDQDALMR